MHSISAVLAIEEAESTTERELASAREAAGRIRELLSRILAAQQTAPVQPPRRRPETPSTTQSGDRPINPAAVGGMFGFFENEDSNS